MSGQDSNPFVIKGFPVRPAGMSGYNYCCNPECFEIVICSAGEVESCGEEECDDVKDEYYFQKEHGDGSV